MKLKKRLLTGLLGQPIGAECPARLTKILVCDKSEADKIIIQHHYSRKPTKNSFMSFLVYYKGEVHGALQLGYGIRPKIKGELDPEVTREFDRMWLSDAMPKFSETNVISLLIFFLKKATSIKNLISYCDTSVGNRGTIYRASNFEQIDAIKADFYILPTGERVHPVTMWHRHKTRAWSALCALYPGIRKAEGQQLKFLYRLGAAGGLLLVAL